MAQDFNPSPGPPNDPNFMNYSRASQQPEPNRGTGIALDTAAQSITGATRFMDESMKQGIFDKVTEGVDKERDQYTSALETINNQLKGQAQPGNQIAAPVRTSTGSTTGKSVFDAYDSADVPEGNLPTGLQDGIDRFTNLTLAKQSGAIKLNDTDYAGKVLSIAKQMRAQYPGYREYIDRATSEISGLPVANAYYQNLLLDVNRQLAAQKASKDQFGQMLEWGLKEGVPHMDTYITQRLNNDPKYAGDSVVLKRINDWTTYKANLAIQAAGRQSQTFDKQDQIDTDTKNITKNAQSLVRGYVNDNIALSGMPSAKDLIGYFEDAASGRIKTNDTEVQQRAIQLQAYSAHMYNKLRADNADLITSIGSDAAEKIFKNAMAPIQTYIDLVNQKDGPLAHFHMQQSQAIMNEDEYNWLTSKDVGAFSRNMIQVRKMYGDQYFPQWIQGMLKTGMDDKMSNRFSQEALAAINPMPDERGNPVPRYMKDAVGDAKKANVPDFNYYGHITGLVTTITDPRMPQPMKDQLIDWAFNPKNQGILNEFRQDYRDPRTGNWVPGKEAAFNRMTAPAMAQTIAESGKFRPENFDKYLNWTRSEFGNAYREDLQQLDQWKFNAGAPGQLSDRPSPYHPAWNNTTKQIVLMDRNDRPVDREVVEKQLGMKPFFDKLDIVNRGLQGLETAYMYSPRRPEDLDVDSYLLRTIRPFITQNKDSFMSQLGRAVIKTNKPEMSMKDIDQMLFGVAP